ncbi:MAG: nucleotide exchange factor GrpE [Christensenellales bacterium]
MNEQKYGGSEKDETQTGAAETKNEKVNETENAAEKTDLALESALKDALIERDGLKDKYQRTFSDFNNYKKRTLKSCADAFKDGQLDVIEKMLPVLDSIDCAFEQIDETKTDKGLLQGFELVCRQLKDTIEKLGVKEIPALGESFDPSLHQAVQMVEPDEGAAAGSVAAVVQKGYVMGDRIIRNSMVVVNKS